MAPHWRIYDWIEADPDTQTDIELRRLIRQAHECASLDKGSGAPIAAYFASLQEMHMCLMHPIESDIPDSFAITFH
jgi:hypothetical protein